MKKKAKIILVSVLTAVLVLTIVGFTIFHILTNPRGQAHTQQQPIRCTPSRLKSICGTCPKIRLHPNISVR